MQIVWMVQAEDWLGLKDDIKYYKIQTCTERSPNSAISGDG